MLIWFIAILSFEYIYELWMYNIQLVEYWTSNVSILSYDKIKSELFGRPPRFVTPNQWWMACSPCNAGMKTFKETERPPERIHIVQYCIDHQELHKLENIFGSEYYEKPWQISFSIWNCMEWCMHLYNT